MARPLRDPISDLISDMSRAIIGTASNFQGNVSDVTEGLTQQIASAVAAESIPTLTSEIRRTLSGSRTKPSAGTGPLPLGGTVSPQSSQSPIINVLSGQTPVSQSASRPLTPRLESEASNAINPIENNVNSTVNNAGSGAWQTSLSQYLSHYGDISDTLKSSIAAAVINNIEQAVAVGSYSTFSAGTGDQKANAKINFAKQHLADIGYDTGEIQNNDQSGTASISIRPATEAQHNSSVNFTMPERDVDRIASATASTVVSVSGGGRGGQIPPIDPPDLPDETISDRASQRAADVAAIMATITAGGSGNRIPPIDPPGPPEPPDDPPDNPRPETLDEGARRRAAETAAIVASITGCSGGNRIPPVDPPGNNPPDPPDDDPDDENDLFRRFMEWLQRFTGVMPDAREFDTLLNNVTEIIGGQPAQPDDPTRPSPLAGFMSAFSDYFSTPQLSPEAQIRAEQDLTEAVEELTQAVTGNTRTRSGTTPRANRTANWIRRRAQRAVVGTAKVLARMARPFARSIGRIVPQNVRVQMTQLGAQIIGQQAQRFGVPAATAARFGATLGPAAALVGGAMIALPIVSAIVRGISSTLSKWSVESLATINRVAKYSPQLTTAQMNLDVARLQRDLNAARRSGPIGAMRVDMQNREEAAWANWEQFKTDTGNLAGTVSSGASVAAGKTVNALGVITGAATMAMGYLQQLPIMADLGKKLIDIFGGKAGDGLDPYRESSFGKWMNNQANGAEAQDQVRRARKPIGPLL